MSKKRTFGLIGKNLSHSFSKTYFTEKFAELAPDCEYVNFEIDHVADFEQIVRSNGNLGGLNVTIPYKEAIIAFLDGLSDHARTIGAVNTIEISGGRRIGHNTDWIGFRQSIEPLLKAHHRHALILGTGGASKAVAFALTAMGIDFRFVSRSNSAALTYEALRAALTTHNLIINTTPLGTWPDIHDAPPIPYHLLTPQHLAYDLIYNPPQSEFLTRAAKFGASTKNGAEMLKLQAEASWKIWNGDFAADPAVRL